MSKTQRAILSGLPKKCEWYARNSAQRWYRWQRVQVDEKVRRMDEAENVGKLRIG